MIFIKFHLFIFFSFFDVDFARLGAELHAATYTVKLGGKFQLVSGSRWIGLDDSKNKNIKDILPTERTQDFIVEGLDLSKTVIQENGLDNIGSFIFFFIYFS